MSRRFLVIVLVLFTCGLAPCRAQGTLQQEAGRLAVLLKWHPGTVVAEIGAGNGTLTMAVSNLVGASGRVYSTDVDPKMLAHLDELAAKHTNITVVKAAESDTKLPSGSCDSILVRLVYHHLTKPAEIDASLLRALKPDGRLAVIDQDPYPGTPLPEGVPQNRAGHGIPQKILIGELVAAGFEVENIDNEWFRPDEYHQMYCVIFHKAKP